jgi:hypothetical protein
MRIKIRSVSLCRCVVLFAMLAAFFGPLLRAQDIRIQVVDGRNGQIISKERLNVWLGPEVGNSILLRIDRNGVASLHLDAKDMGLMSIEANNYFDCRPFGKNAPRPTYSLTEIVKSGIATENICGKLTTEAKAGELVFFVRPLHWWDGVRR